MKKKYTQNINRFFSGFKMRNSIQIEKKHEIKIHRGFDIEAINVMKELKRE